MAICNKKCANIPPTAVSSCEKEIRTGGISHLVFARCDVKFTDIQDPVQWCNYVRDGKIIMSPPLVAQKPKGNFTTKLRNSCAMEDVSGLEQTITFQDHNADTERNKDFDFWQSVQKNADFMQFGWITCEGHFYGFVPKFTMELGYVIEETNLDSSFWDGSIMWQSMEIIKPQYIYNLTSYLQGNCDEVLNFNECAFENGELPYFDNWITQFAGNTIYSCGSGFPLSSMFQFQNFISLKIDYISNATYRIRDTITGIILFDSEVDAYSIKTEPNATIIEVPIEMPYSATQGNPYNVTSYGFYNISIEIDIPGCATIIRDGIDLISGSDHNIDITFTPDNSGGDNNQIDIVGLIMFGNAGGGVYWAWKDPDNPTPLNYNTNVLPTSSLTLSNIESGQEIVVGMKEAGGNGCEFQFNIIFP